MKKFAKYILVSVFAFAFLANQAYAITVSQLVAAGFTQSQAELVIALLGGSDDNSGSCYTHTVTLRVGSTGSQVMAMQKVVGTTADGNFGPATKAAVMAWQSNNGLVADGIVGPNTGAAMSGNCSSDDDDDDDSPSLGSDDLQGDVGSVSLYETMSQYSNETVGEGEDDVIVAGLRIEADNGSDIRISSLKLEFDHTGSGSEDLDDYVDEVSVWFDGDKVGEADVDDFSEDSSNRWDKTINLDSSVVIDADEEGELVVAVNALSNIDSNDLSQNWSVDFQTVRFVDAQGVVTSEDAGTSGVTFDFGTFATSADVEMKVNLDNDSPDAMVVEVDSTSDTDNVELLVFTIEAEGTDIMIEDLPVLITVTGATDTDFVANTLHLEVSGDMFSETVSTSSAETATTVTFDDIDIEISEGNEMTFTVLADINDLDSNFEAGDTIKAELRSFEVDAIDAEDEQGDAISDADATGTALGEQMSFYETGLRVISAEATAVAVPDGNGGSDDDKGEFTFEVTVEAFGGTVYISDTAAATVSTDVAESTLTSANNLYRITDSGTSTTDDVSYDLNYTTSQASESSAGQIELADGEQTTITLFVVVQNDTIEDDGIYRGYLEAILWNTTDATNLYNVYDFDFDEDDFYTNAISLN